MQTDCFYNGDKYKPGKRIRLPEKILECREDGTWKEIPLSVPEPQPVPTKEPAHA